MVKSPVLYTAGLLRRIGRPIDTSAWVWLDSMSGQQLFYPPNVGGWDDTRWLDTATWRGRWWIAQSVLDPYALDPGKAKQPYDADTLVRDAIGFWRQPALGAATLHGLQTFARNAVADAKGQKWKQQQYPPMAQNALRHLIAVSPELPGRVSDCLHCDGLTRSRLLHRAIAEAGRGLPAIEPGMPMPAGTGLSRRRFLAQGLGATLAVYGATRLGLPAFEEGIAAAAAAQPQQVLVSVFLEGGADGLSVLSPQGDPLYRTLRPTLGLAGGTPLAEDPRLFWHPATGGLAQLYGEHKVTVMPAVGYTHPDQSHFTSRHYWEVGATDTRLNTGWLGRYLDAVGDDGQPAAGPLASTTRSRPALATAKVPVAAISAPDQYDFYSNRVWGEVEQRMLESFGLFGGRRIRRCAPSPASRSGRPLRNQLLPFRSQDGKPGYTSPVTYPQSDDDFPKKLAGLAAMIAAGLPLRVVALSAPGEYDTHSDEPSALTQGLQLTSDSLLAFQRDLEARGVADRVLVHVWSEFGRRAQENGSAGTDHGAAGVGFLVGTRVKGTDGRRVPGARGRERPRRRRQPDRDGGLPRRLLRRCSSSGSAWTRGRSCRARPRSRRRR